MQNTTALCTSCGLCCNGVLFAFVQLDAQEAEWATRRRLPVVLREDTPTLDHPCAVLHGTTCSDYESRPSRCRAYRCDLLRELEGGTLALEQARAIAARAQMLHTKLHPNGRRDVDASVLGVEELLDLGELEALTQRIKGRRVNEASP